MSTNTKEARRHLEAFRKAMVEAGVHLQLARDKGPGDIRFEDLIDGARIDWESACRCTVEADALLAELERAASEEGA